ncbi:MAG TPA: hypothetical protein DEP36_04460 [Gammaproteobacteria bacterium]|nr:hypothetical protein [Gammaproteobacteria bacterium]
MDFSTALQSMCGQRNNGKRVLISVMFNLLILSICINLIAESLEISSTAHIASAPECSSTLLMGHC